MITSFKQIATKKKKLMRAFENLLTALLQKPYPIPINI